MRLNFYTQSVQYPTTYGLERLIFVADCAYCTLH